MKTIRTLIIIFLACFTASASQSQPLQSYWAGTSKGKYTVGFKSICVFDKSRKYDLSCGDSTVKVDKNLGRPILMNIWYPAKQADNMPVLEEKDYFDFPADENTKYFFTLLRKYQFKETKIYAIDRNIKKENFSGDTLIYEKVKKTTYENYMSLKAISHRNAKPEKGEFPIVIYHQGLGGTIDEDRLLLEYLASNGYIVITSAFQRSNGAGFVDGWSVAVGDNRATFDDINFIINYCKQKNISKNKVFLMGHSYGANSAISFIGEGHRNIDGIVSIDSDFGYVLYSFYPPKYNPFVKDKLKFYANIPIFCIGREEAHFRMVDSLSSSTRYYLTMAGMKHSDFASQGVIGKYYCLPYMKMQQQQYKQVAENYENMCAAVLVFLDSYTKASMVLKKEDITIRTGWRFEVCKPAEKLLSNKPFVALKGKCPTTSQFLDLIYSKGINKAGNVYTNCIDNFSKKDETLLDIWEAMYVDAKIDSAIQFLNWINQKQMIEGNLKNLFLLVSYNSLLDRGNGFHYAKADSIYSWMIQKFPNDKYGYMGRLLVSIYIQHEVNQKFCKKLVELGVNSDTVENTMWDQRVKMLVSDYLQKPK